MSYFSKRTKLSSKAELKKFAEHEQKVTEDARKFLESQKTGSDRVIRLNSSNDPGIKIIYGDRGLISSDSPWYSSNRYIGKLPSLESEEMISNTTSSTTGGISVMGGIDPISSNNVRITNTDDAAALINIESAIHNAIFSGTTATEETGQEQEEVAQPTTPPATDNIPTIGVPMRAGERAYTYSELNDRFGLFERFPENGDLFLDFEDLLDEVRDNNDEPELTTFEYGYAENQRFINNEFRLYLYNIIEIVYELFRINKNGSGSRILAFPLIKHCLDSASPLNFTYRDQVILIERKDIIDFFLNNLQETPLKAALLTTFLTCVDGFYIDYLEMVQQNASNTWSIHANVVDDIFGRLAEQENPIYNILNGFTIAAHAMVNGGIVRSGSFDQILEAIRTRTSRRERNVSEHIFEETGELKIADKHWNNIEKKKKALKKKLNEDEEIIININDLAEKLTTEELSKKYSDFEICKYEYEYKHVLNKKIEFIKTFKIVDDGE